MAEASPSERDLMRVERLEPAEVRAALRDEGLTRWSWFEAGPVRPDEVGIREDGDGWLVYSTDERADEAYRRYHDDESAALADFLRRARVNTRYFRHRAERVRADAERARRGQAAAGDESAG